MRIHLFLRIFVWLFDFHNTSKLLYFDHMSSIFNSLQFCSDFFDDWGNQNIKSDMNMPGNTGFFFEKGTKRG